MEKKVADLTVQLELSKSRGGGVLEDELSEKFEWLRSQQEQMLVVMTEAIREGKLGGGEAEPAEPVVPKQPPLHADAAATIQAVRVVCRHATRPPLASCNKDAESCVGLCTGAPRPCGTDTAGRGERRGPDGPGAVALAPPAGVLPQPPQRRGGGPSQIPSNRFDTDMCRFNLGHMAKIPGSDARVVGTGRRDADPGHVAGTAAATLLRLPRERRAW